MNNLFLNLFNIEISCDCHSGDAEIRNQNKEQEKWAALQQQVLAYQRESTWETHRSVMFIQLSLGTPSLPGTNSFNNSNMEDKQRIHGHRVP